MDRDSDLTDRPLPQPGRLWTVEQANAQLESIREILPKLRAWVVRLRRVHDELHRLATFWGKELTALDHPDRALKERLEEEWRDLTNRLEREVGRLQEIGIEVKDLESGLVDFYALQNGEVVFLCWQRGETEVGYYHTLEGGFRNRRPLPNRSARPALRSGSG